MIGFQSKEILLSVMLSTMLLSCGGSGGSVSTTAANTAVNADTGATAGSGSTGTSTDSSGGGTSLSKSAKILFLHHSTGGVIWEGGVADWISGYNSAQAKSYQITEQYFPSGSPYPWANYPYDYWNIWVNHAGSVPYQQEPTLEILTAQYDVIIWKHCFPVSDIEPDTGSPTIDSETKTLENYKLQYEALKAKMRSFPNVRFLVWTGAAQIEELTTPEQAGRAQEFSTWVKQSWDEPGDNIFVWDFRHLETGGGPYLLPKYSAGDSHPNSTLGQMAAPWLGRRIVDVIEGRGDSGSITGQ